jgi:hypothetical protein
VLAQAVVEIAPDADGQLPVELIRHAYRASEQGLIVLILQDITPSAVDRILDPLVSMSRLDIPGVLYIDAKNQSAVLQAVHDAQVIFAATDRLRSLIAAFGMRCGAVQPATAALEAMTRLRLPVSSRERTGRQDRQPSGMSGSFRSQPNGLDRLPGKRASHERIRIVQRHPRPLIQSASPDQR